jgi:glucosamine--fructose-6-phosphate aminotransferase (isomerizing)
MCGIFGIVRHHVQKANSFLVDDLITGISRLEYRGYDSAGIAIICE